MMIHVTINGVAVENVKECTYLGAVFTNTYGDSPEIKEELLLPKTPQLLSISSGKTEALP